MHGQKIHSTQFSGCAVAIEKYIMASNQEKRREEVRFLVLRLLNEDPNMSTRQLARKIGISNGSAYYCLTELLKKGLLKLGNFKASKHKGRYAYILTPRGIREKVILTTEFLDRKYKEFDDLKREITLLEDEVGSKSQAKYTRKLQE